jgi:hypothetical protein
MSRRRSPRSVRKKLWRLLGFSTPREQRLAREKTWRALAQMRRVGEAFACLTVSLTDLFARTARAVALICSSLGKVPPNAFS